MTHTSTQARSLVYDAPTRLFHWLFAGLFLTTFAIANLAGDEAPLFPLHMLAGILLASLVLLRLIWGLVGTRNARFGSFALHPRALFAYLRGVLTGGGARWAGHNPASSWAALLMTTCAVGLAITGLLMTTSGETEAYEEVHEVLANTFAITALLHVAGVVLHTLRCRDGFPRSMVDGRKQDVPEEERISSARPVMALWFLGLMATATFGLWNSYDSQSNTLAMFGATMQLGENEREEDD
jgi:cytochrome b